MKSLLYILTIVFLFGCGSSTNKQSGRLSDTINNDSLSQTDWTIDKVSDTKLIFKDGKSFDTKLYQLEYIGQIPVDKKAPYLVFSGRDCKECDANISIYIHSPSDGQLIVGDGKNCYAYPGSEKDYETNNVLYKARAFYGQVLKNIKGVIWYQSQLLMNGKMNQSVFLSHIVNGSLKDTTFTDNGLIKETLNLLNKGQCKEIQGREYTSQP
jgi:hypothetical protein